MHIVLRDFRILVQAARAHFATTRAATGLSGAQIWALAEIANSPGVRITQLARALSIHQSTASNLVAELLRGNLIEKSADTLDGRSSRLHITTAGRALLDASPSPYEGVLPSALKSLTSLELTALHTALRPLLKKLPLADQPRSALTPLSDLLEPESGEKRR